MLTFYFFGAAGACEDPLGDQIDVLKNDEGRREARLVVVLHHQEVHTVLPDLDRVSLHFLEHVTTINIFFIRYSNQ